MAQSAADTNVPLVADDVDDGDSALGLGPGSDTTSLYSNIMKYRQENGRTYHAYKDGSYVIPNDASENERLDFQHHLFYLTFDGKLHLAPVGKSEKQLHRVLDAGTGTGIWAIDFADEHPESHVVGVDLSPIQPNFVPPNVAFHVDDLEDPWTFSNNFDFIYVRNMTGSIADWPKFFKQSFDTLAPGGYIELCDITFPVECDDGSLPKDSVLLKWSQMLLDSMIKFGRPINTATTYKALLEAAGFEDVVEHRLKWPSNRWPKDPKHKEMGTWMYENFSSGMSGFSLALFTRPKDEGGMGWTVQEMEVFLTDARKELKDTKIHSYWPLYVVYGKKPG